MGARRKATEGVAEAACRPNRSSNGSAGRRGFGLGPALPVALALFAFSALCGCEDGPELRSQRFVSQPMNPTYADVELPVSLWGKIENVYTDRMVDLPPPYGAAKGDEFGRESGQGAHATKPAAHGNAHDTHGDGHGQGDGHGSGDENAGHGDGHDKGHGKGHDGGHEGGPGADSGEGGAVAGNFALGREETPTRFMAVKVYLAEKNRGILGGRNHELVFGDGGGEIDLKDFVADRNGTFHFGVEAVIPVKEKDKDRELPPVRVFYLSNAVRRKLGRAYFGAGCNNYHEITTFLADAMNGEGIRVNSTEGRHVSVLAGTYFFAVKFDGKLNLAHLTVKDSRYRSLHCRR